MNESINVNPACEPCTCEPCTCEPYTCAQVGESPKPQRLTLSMRVDFTSLEADLIEEIARLFGYDNIPTLPVQGASQAGVNSEATASLAEIRQRLVSRGFNEAITFSFVSPDAQALFDPDWVPVALKNPISSDLAVMRTSLLPGLAGAAAHNIKRQATRIRLFESCGFIGRSIQGSYECRHDVGTIQKCFPSRN